MKKGILILVLVTSAATAFNQSSRRTTNVNADRTSRDVTHKTTNSSSTNSVRVANVNSETSKSVNYNRSSAASHRHYVNKKTTYTYYPVRAKQPKKVVHYEHRVPGHIEIVWTSDMHRTYRQIYPSHHHWNYSYGYRIESIHASKAGYFAGDVKNVYGRINDVFYSRESDEYLLYVGDYYPNQQFTIVVPGHIARYYSRKPGYYYMNQYVNVTGLISVFEGKPEIVVRQNSQINIY